MRADERTNFATVKAELEQVNSEVQNARDTVRDHYGGVFVLQLAAPQVYKRSGGTGSLIVGMPGMIESVFSNYGAELSPLLDQFEEIRKGLGQGQARVQDGPCFAIKNLMTAVFWFGIRPGGTDVSFLLTQVGYML